MEPVTRLNGMSVVAVSGIARNERFVAMLRDAGATLRATLGFPDHHRYREKDWNEIVRAASGAERIVTTEKDLVKLRRFAPGDPRLTALRIDLDVGSGDEVLDAVCARAGLDASARGQHDRPRPAGN